MTAAWESFGSWDVPTTDTDKPIEPNPAGITIELAVEKYLADHRRHSADNTVKKYTVLMAKLKAFAAGKGYISLNRWTPTDVREFRDSWKISLQTAAKDMSVIKAFFSFCMQNEWLDRNPASLVKAPRGRSSKEGRNQQKQPFTDEELGRMYAACDLQYGKRPVKWSRKVHHHPASPAELANYKYRWTGQDLKDFIDLAIHTGLRISDLATFNVDRLKPSGECHIRTTKTGIKVFTWIPEWLQEDAMPQQLRLARKPIVLPSRLVYISGSR